MNVSELALRPARAPLDPAPRVSYCFKLHSSFTNSYVHRKLRGFISYFRRGPADGAAIKRLENPELHWSNAAPPPVSNYFSLCGVRLARAQLCFYDRRPRLRTPAWTRRARSVSAHLLNVDAAMCFWKNIQI
ncbi:hypothetical protein EVAR_81607_1 [Eumeta japonica]|uniref:Uncharacterized protein n=1 Tax=Eumeta variegata TaxID=151549 RepID=A0A4C1WFY4_EUMVA|nr:hypothetical protein EVAR_81607_1 [Eumeta japonica]